MVQSKWIGHLRVSNVVSLLQWNVRERGKSANMIIKWLVCISWRKNQNENKKEKLRVNDSNQTRSWILSWWSQFYEAFKVINYWSLVMIWLLTDIRRNKGVVFVDELTVLRLRKIKWHLKVQLSRKQYFSFKRVVCKTSW